MADEEHDDDHEAEQSTPADSSIPAEQEDRIVDRVVDKLKRAWGEITGPGGEPPSAGGSGEQTTAPPLGTRATEDDMEAKVKAAVEEKITARERRVAAADARAAHDAEHERIKTMTEKPPKTYSRLTTTLWGSDAE
jgi:hypothetical protein